jgi:hypothetical protein
MANFELYLKDFFPCQKAQILKENQGDNDVIAIRFYDLNGKFLHPFVMDKSTAIKFAKTLRTEINKITESEVNND